MQDLLAPPNKVLRSPISTIRGHPCVAAYAPSRSESTKVLKTREEVLHRHLATREKLQVRGGQPVGGALLRADSYLPGIID